MAIENDGRRITSAPFGGPTQNSQAVHFDLRFEDGTKERFHCLYEAIPKLLGSLKLYAGMTERARNLMPGQTVDVVLPYRATSIRPGHIPRTKEVLLHFQTEDGIPVSMAMNQSLAAKAIELLQAAILQSQSDTDHRN